MVKFYVIKTDDGYVAEGDAYNQGRVFVPNKEAATRFQKKKWAKFQIHKNAWVYSWNNPKVEILEAPNVY